MATSPFTATDKAKIVRKARSLARLSESFLDIEPEMMKTSAGMTRVSFVAGKGDALVATARIHGKTHRFSMAPKRRTKPRKTANPSRLVAKPKAGALAYSVKVDGKTISGGRYRSLAAAREVFRELQRRYPGRVEMFRGTESYSSWGVSDARRMKATRKKHHSKTRRARR